MDIGKIKILQDGDMLSIKHENGVSLFYDNETDFDRSGENFKQLFEKLNFDVEIIVKPYEEW